MVSSQRFLSVGLPVKVQCIQALAKPSQAVDRRRVAFREHRVYQHPITRLRYGCRQVDSRISLTVPPENPHRGRLDDCSPVVGITLHAL